MVWSEQMYLSLFLLLTRRSRYQTGKIGAVANGTAVALAASVGVFGISLGAPGDRQVRLTNPMTPVTARKTAAVPLGTVAYFLGFYGQNPDGRILAPVGFIRVMW